MQLFLPKWLQNKIVVQPNVHAVIKTRAADPGEDDSDPIPTLEEKKTGRNPIDKKNRIRIRPSKNKPEWLRIRP